MTFGLHALYLYIQYSSLLQIGLFTSSPSPFSDFLQLDWEPTLPGVFKMSNPCECCESKLRFIRQINGNFMHSMVIPEWFANYFGRKIPGTVKLEVSSGSTYDVRVTVNMNRTILKSGWPRFVDANQIEENYSLMFRYLGNARFEVAIFDCNGKEKGSCCDAMQAAPDVQTPNGRNVDNSSSSHDGTTRSSSCEGSDSDGCPKESSCHYCEAAKMAALSYTSDEISEDSQSADESEEFDDLQRFSKDYVLSGRIDLTVAQERNIHALVTEIQPKIPVLVVLIKKTNVERHADLVIHKDCALVYFPQESQTIRVKVPRKSKDWQCNLRIRADGGCNLRLGNFIRDNSVREGDLCLFQPITEVKVRRFTVMVHLLRKESLGHSPGRRTNDVSNHRRTRAQRASTAHVKKEPATDGQENSSSGPEDHGSSDSSDGSFEPPFMLSYRLSLTQAQEKKVLEKVEAIESELPIYVAVMKKSNVRRFNTGNSLTFGTRYTSRYLEKKYATERQGNTSVISLVLQRERKGRTWDTELRRRSDRTFTTLSKGWASFARDNHLRQDDLCLFKLVENEEPLKMMVYIIRREKC